MVPPWRCVLTNYFAFAKCSEISKQNLPLKCKEVSSCSSQKHGLREAINLCNPRWVWQLEEGHECLNIYLNIKPENFKTHTDDSADILREFWAGTNVNLDLCS